MTATNSQNLRRTERASLVFFAVIAAAYGALIAIGSTTHLVETLTARTISTQLYSVFDVPASAVTGTATLISGSFDTAVLELANVSMAARMLSAGSILSLGLAQILIAGTIVFVSIGLFRGRPFSRGMTWLLATASVTLIIGGLLGYGLGVAAQFTIAGELNANPVESVFPLMGGVDFTVLFLGLVLGVVAAAFELGERLQRDTERLQRDTEGLI